MKTYRFLTFLMIALTGTLSAGAAGAATAPAAASTPPDWSMNASIIEACSCPMFCPCYFNTKPAAHSGHEGHGEEHFCRFNRAFRINSGHFGRTKLAGVKFWMAGDLGGDFSTDQMDWAALTFEPTTAKAQRTAITTILTHVYP